MDEKKERPVRLIDLAAVCRMTSRSRSSIYRDIETGAFPAPLKTGPKSNAWLESEVIAWIEGLPRRKAGADEWRKKLAATIRNNLG
jgi:prophage regulatory protein